MHRSLFRSLTMVALFLLCGGWSPLACASPSPSNLTILLDDALMRPMVSIARDYGKAKGIPINLITLNPAQVAEQIEQGMDAQLLITAHPDLIATITNHGLSDVSTRGIIARAPLALVAPHHLAHRLKMTPHFSFATMLYAQPNLPIYCPPLGTPEGEAVAALLRRPEFAGRIAPRAILLKDRTHLADHLRMREGFALMLASDVPLTPSVTLLETLPDTIAYEAAVLAGESMKATRDFLIYLGSNKGEKALKKSGLYTKE